MAYIGPEPNPGQNREVDDISSSFNGSLADFTLQVNSQNVSPGSSNAIIVSLGGVVQNPGTDYTVAASTLTFTTAPASGLSFFGLVLGQQVDTEGFADGGTLNNPVITGDLSIADKIVHTGDTNNAIRFPAADTITAETAGSERVRVDSSGNVGIGTASPNSFSNYKVLTIQGGTSGSGIDLEKSDGNIYGRLFADADGLQIQSTQSGDSIRFETNGSNVRARITDDGLCFNADTAAANALDDYEEGTWTPIIRTPNGTGVAGTGNAGFYTKVGNVVHAHATVHWTSISGTTSTVVQILGLPFSTKNVSNYRSTTLLGGQIVGVHNGNDDGMNIAIGVDANQSFVYVTGVNGSVTASYNYTHTPTVTSAGQIFGFAITYLT
jgi:hypothetical protein